MKKFKKLLCVLVSLTLAFGITAAYGCNLDDDEQIDPDRTQLYVGVFNGGVGVEWLRKMKRLYEAEHSDVQIMIEPGQTIYETSALQATIEDRLQDVYFVDGVNYYEFIRADLLMDITDIVTEPYEGGYTVESIMNESLRDYYKTEDGKYYAVPYYQGEHQIIYDVDLFEQEELYIKSIGEDGSITAWTGAADKHVGADGKAGTYDDGLPVTYSQFFALIERMKSPEKGIVPFTWSGDNWDTYLTKFLPSVSARYSGEAYRMNFDTSLDGEGTAIEVVDAVVTPHTYGTFSSENYTTKTVTVSWDNYEEIQNMAGNYFALCFARDVMNEPSDPEAPKNYDSPAVGPGDTHMDAQERFLMSRFMDEPVAMLIDGAWWENEAQGVFDDMAYDFGPQWSRGNRRFAMMPIPNSDDMAASSALTLSPFSGTSAAFIRKNATQPEIAKDFFSFIHSKEMLGEFTAVSNTLRPYDYELSEEQSSRITYYTKNQMEIYAAADTVYRMPNSATGKNNEGYFANNWFFLTTNGEGYQAPFHSFFRTALTPEDYFYGLTEYQTANKGEFIL